MHLSRAHLSACLDLVKAYLAKLSYSEPLTFVPRALLLLPSAIAFLSILRTDLAKPYECLEWAGSSLYSNMRKIPFRTTCMYLKTF